MPTILLHSSKTMQQRHDGKQPYQQPSFIKQAAELAGYIRTLPSNTLAQCMQLSPAMAEKTHDTFNEWSTDPAGQLPAMDAFLGDIYSGLQVASFSQQDRYYANDHLFILSGLYGILRALDSIAPYRLEIGYRFPNEPYRNLYAFWGDRLATIIPAGQPIINLSAVEYTKALLPHLPDTTIIAPKFMTISPKTGQPIFVTVHAKIARGAFAHWLIRNRVDDTADLSAFTELGYTFDATLSTPAHPVFVCKEFKGLGLSVRLT